MSRKGNRRGPWWYCPCDLPHDYKTRWSEDCSCPCCEKELYRRFLDKDGR